MPRRKAKAKQAQNDDDELLQKVEGILMQFDMEVNRRVYEMQRSAEHVCAHVDSMFKLARLKVPSAVREQLWEDGEQQQAAEATLSAVEAELSEAERTVQQKKPAAGGRGRTTRAAATPALVTPLQPPRPLHSSTPAVTPKFDPRTVQRQPPGTVRRHRPHEVLMSLQGSPVIPDQGAAAATAAAPEPDSRRLMVQTTEVLQKDVELDAETMRLAETLRDQLIDLTSKVNEAM